MGRGWGSRGKGVGSSFGFKRALRNSYTSLKRGSCMDLGGEKTICISLDASEALRLQQSFNFCALKFSYHD